MRNILLIFLLCSLLLTGCAQSTTQGIVKDEEQSVIAAPSSFPLSVSSEMPDSFKIDSTHSLFKKKDITDISSFKNVEFKKSSLRKLESNIGMQGNGQMAVIDGQLFIYNAPSYIVETCSYIDLDAPFVYRINPDTLEIVDTLQLSEKATVAFSKNNILVMYADRIERYNAKFELIDTFKVPSDAYSLEEEWWARNVLALDNDNIIYTMAEQDTPNILNITTKEVKVMPAFINGGGYSTFYAFTDSDIIGCYSYKPRFLFFVNRKTMEQIDAIKLSDDETETKTALSMSNLTLYQIPKAYAGLLYLTKDSDGIYYTRNGLPLEIYDFVNEKQTAIKAQSDKEFNLSSSVRTEDGRVFLLVFTSDRKATICETYLYRID